MSDISKSLKRRLAGKREEASFPVSRFLEDAIDEARDSESDPDLRLYLLKYLATLHRKASGIERIRYLEFETAMKERGIAGGKYKKEIEEKEKEKEDKKREPKS
jgi:hypothetical protein